MKKAFITYLFRSSYLGPCSCVRRGEAQRPGQRLTGWGRECAAWTPERWPDRGQPWARGLKGTVWQIYKIYRELNWDHWAGICILTGFFLLFSRSFAKRFQILGPLYSSLAYNQNLQNLHTVPLTYFKWKGFIKVMQTKRRRGVTNQLTEGSEGRGQIWFYTSWPPPT